MHPNFPILYKNASLFRNTHHMTLTHAHTWQQTRAKAIIWAKSFRLQEYFKRHKSHKKLWLTVVALTRVKSHNFLLSLWIIHCENKRIWPYLLPCAHTHVTTLNNSPSPSLHSTLCLHNKIINSKNLEKKFNPRIINSYFNFLVVSIRQGIKI